MVNTGGLSWDIGVVPYEPTPGQWMRRHAKILECREKYGLCGLMESHHYGFWPSFISDLAKWTYTAGTPEPEQVLGMLAERDFGPANVDKVLQAWALWSKGIQHYMSTQRGPVRSVQESARPSRWFFSRPVKVPEVAVRDVRQPDLQHPVQPGRRRPLLVAVLPAAGGNRVSDGLCGIVLPGAPTCWPKRCPRCRAGCWNRRSA